MVERVRWRLQEANKHESQSFAESEFRDLYYEDGEGDAQETRDRQRAFYNMMTIFLSPEYPEASKEWVAAHCGPFFSIPGGHHQ